MLGIKKSGSGGTTLIAEGTTVVGEVQFNGNLDVEGVVQGNIVAGAGKDAVVRVIGKGRVEGDIHAPYVVINGTVRGDVHASAQLDLASKGRVDGNVFYALVEMAAGSEVNGSLTHVSGSQTSDKPAEVPSVAEEKKV